MIESVMHGTAFYVGTALAKGVISIAQVLVPTATHRVEVAALRAINELEAVAPQIAEFASIWINAIGLSDSIERDSFLDVVRALFYINRTGVISEDILRLVGFCLGMKVARSTKLAVGVVVPRVANEVRVAVSQASDASARLHAAGWRSGTKLIAHGVLHATSRTADFATKFLFFIAPPVFLFDIGDGIAFLNGKTYWRDACGNEVPVTIARDNYTYCKEAESVSYLQNIREKAAYEQIKSAAGALVALPICITLLHTVKRLANRANASFN